MGNFFKQIAYKQVIAHIEKEPNYKDILAALKGIK
jgi:hypothetical protein